MTEPTNPNFDIAHLGHVEIYTDRFDESLDFFTRVFGLKLSGREGIAPICAPGTITSSTR
ncbi:hypothetical protein KU6B_25040 [Mameliella alba]|uniref:VOC family protein n=1 Tax=Mameliella alba TaxID=561184 RepID=UPI0013E42794|nr:VOC family protein [Mameliella alba]BBU56239.1 hypothetical protein KU6B_25040 [Mameliella alba]